MIKYKCLRYLMVMKILILIFFFEIKESKITREHNYRLVKKKVDWTLESILFHRGPSVYGITYQLIAYMLVVLIMFNNKIDKDLIKAGYT